MELDTALGRGERLAWIAILPLLLYLLLTGAGASNGVLLTPFRVVSLLLLVVLFAAWGVAAWRYPEARPSSALAPALILVPVTLTLAAAASAYPRLGLEYAAYAVILGALYLILVRLLARAALRRRLAVVVAGCTFALAAGYVITVAALWVEWWGLIGGIATPPTRPGYEALTYGAPGILTAFLATAGAASVALLWPMGQRFRVAAGALGVLVLLAIFLASARAGWAAVAVALVATGLVALLTGERVRLPRTRRAWGALGVVAAVGIGALALVGPAVLRRLETGGGEELRSTLVTTALRMFGDHPILGTGPGTWVTLRASRTAAGEVDYYIPHAHNAPAQVLAETGVVGALVVLVVLVLVARLVVTAVRGGDRDRRALGLGVVFAGTYLLVHQLFDFFMDTPAVLFAGVLALAALDATAPRIDPHRFPGRAVAAVPALGAVLAAALLLGVEVPAMQAERASANQSAGAPGEAVTDATEALGRDPEQTAYRWIRALAAADAGDVPTARSDFLAVAERDDLPQAWLNLAALDVEAGEYGPAAEHLERALRLGIQQPAVAVGAVPLWLQLGDDDKAIEAAASALVVAPSLADDPWWDTSPGLAAVRDAVVEQATADPVRGWQVAMFAGNLDAARRQADELPNGETDLATTVIDAWAGVPGARAALEEAAIRSPLGGAASWASRIAARDGDATSAERFRRWAVLGFGTSGADFGNDIVITDAPRDRMQVPGPNANYHFRYAYRRTVPWDMLVDALPRLTVR